MTSRHSARKNLVIVFALTFVFMIVEIVVGIISNSLSLLADAGHMLFCVNLRNGGKKNQENIKKKG